MPGTPLRLTLKSHWVASLVLTSMCLRRTWRHPSSLLSGAFWIFVHGSPGLPAWFRRELFSSHAAVRLRSKLAAGLESLGLGIGAFPKGVLRV